MIERLIKLTKYNRDWMKYVALRFGRMNAEESVVFRLRNGQKIRLFRDARFILNEIYLDRVYDVPGVDLGLCTSVLDIGANVGAFALYTVSKAPQASVYCFEPARKNYDMLVRNLTTNRANVRAYRLAVAADCGTVPLVTGDLSINYSIRATSSSSEIVQTVNMSEVFAMAGVDRFDFVKMDVEGAELEILASCTDEQLRRMSAISMEWHHSTRELQSAVERLRSIGFEATAQTIDNRYLKARFLG